MLLQKLPPTLKTFVEISDYLHEKLLQGSARISFFVTDFYLKDSVKSMERDRRSASGSIRIKATRRDQAVPKQFSKFLRNAENKLDLLDFFVRDWTTNDEHSRMFEEKELYFTIRDKALRIYLNNGRLSNSNVPEISSKQEEADTKMFLCAAFATSLGFRSVNIVTVDTEMSLF